MELIQDTVSIKFQGNAEVFFKAINAEMWMVEMPCSYKNLTSYHCICARDLHGNVMYVIRKLNSVFLNLFLDMFLPLDPKCPLVNEMLSHIYTKYVSGILGLGG